MNIWNQDSQRNQADARRRPDSSSDRGQDIPSRALSSGIGAKANPARAPELGSATLRELKEALQEFEETKGDWSKDH